ncbi:phosphoribosyltransferase [Bailinhaonella thermotolerans]|uniref:Phosphoribosyltransferase n=1 Tax=Bailinhaonella thermotolerans TaxID=1070861 RepID=A0A3A4A234_9ACTN|nr:phosphoribosyltransferase family protein [Bailinhaonella thermotolerans]RJL22726.1 phosphoribosyltransferase [Bailinhaonella thermotolerans]
MMFRDRAEAGRLLGEALARMEWADPLVLGLARGGVPIAREIARVLGAPFDVAVARKIGAPGQPEFGVGAVTAEGPPVYDGRSLDALDLDETDLAKTCSRERAEARRRVEVYRAGRAEEPVRGRDVILSDDGLATGVTARAALGALRPLGPSRLVFAAPVCSIEGAAALAGDADEVVCLDRPADFLAVGRWYEDFAQLTDDDVLAFLRERDTAAGSR